MDNNAVNPTLAKFVGPDGYTEERYWPVADDDDYSIRQIPKDFRTDWNALLNNALSAWTSQKRLLPDGFREAVENCNCDKAAHLLADAVLAAEGVMT